MRKMFHCIEYAKRVTSLPWGEQFMTSSLIFDPSFGPTNSSPKEITFENAKAENERFLSQIDTDARKPSACRFNIGALECDKILTGFVGHKCRF